MRGEIYVTLLIHRWERSRQITERLYRQSKDVRTALHEAASDQLGNTFSELADKLARELGPRPPDPFAERHFQALTSPRVIKTLARVLDCSEGEALDTLLDPLPMRRALDEVSPHIGRANATADLLASEMRSRAEEIRLSRGLAENEWGDFLEAKRWIKRPAMLRLRREGERRNWPSETGPATILAGLIDLTERAQQGPDPYTDEGDPYDSLAIGSIRQRVDTLVAALRREAESHFADALESAPSIRSLGMLQGWFDLYDKQAVALGLSRLCGGTRILATLLEGARTEDKGLQGAPEPEEYLTTKPEMPYVRRRDKFLRQHDYVTFSIMCQVHGIGLLLPVLDVVALPVEDYRYVSEGISRLRGRDLSAVGDTLGQRLLNTAVTVSNDLTGRLRAAVLRNSALMAQTIVLSGIRQPIQVTVPWQNELSDELGYTVADPNLDTKIDGGRVDELIAKLTADYSDQGVTLTMLS